MVKVKCEDCKKGKTQGRDCYSCSGKPCRDCGGGYKCRVCKGTGYREKYTPETALKALLKLANYHLREGFSDDVEPEELAEEIAKLAREALR